LDEGDAVVRIALGLLERADLAAKTFANREAGSIICCGRDAEAGGKAAEVAAEALGNRREVPLRIDAGDVGVYAKTHLPVSPSIVRLDAGRSHGPDDAVAALAEGEEV
jgi:hypothetical protein